MLMFNDCNDVSREVQGNRDCFLEIEKCVVIRINKGIDILLRI